MSDEHTPEHHDHQQPRGYEHFQQPKPDHKDPNESILAWFIPRKGFFFTPLIIDVNILVFIAMVVSGVHIISPDSLSLIKWGADFRPLTLDGQWWRMLTCCFIHIGILHLLMNMYGLLYIGVLLEPLMGRLRFITAYLLTGVASSATSLWWHDSTVSAGASGAIFGMYGVFLALLTTSLIEKQARDALLSSTMVFVGFNLLNGMRGGIDNAAHIGGLLSGVLIGYALLPSIKNEANKNLKAVSVGGITLLILGAIFVLLSSLPNDSGKFNTKMKEFSELESKGLAVYELPESASNEEMLNTIRETCLPAWQQNLTLLDEADQLDISEPLHTRIGKLRTYCDLRIKTLELIAGNLETGTNLNEPQLNEYNQQIKSLMEEMNE